MKNLLILLITVVLTVGVTNGQPSKTSPSRSKAPSSTKPFRPTKTQITEAQNKLKAAGKYSGDADGKYNDDFRTSIKAFQEANGLEKNGRLDEPTLSKMGIDLSVSKRESESTSGDAKNKRTSFRANKSQITEAQDKLKTSGSYKGESTGKYNDDFRAAVKEFQGNNELTKSGSLNRATLEKMGIGLTDTQSAIPVNPKDLGSGDLNAEAKKRGPVFRASKEQIMQVQKMLKAKNLYSGDETGKLDDDTRAAIRAWQNQNGVKETGTLNKATLEAMNIELTDKQKAM